MNGKGKQYDKATVAKALEELDNGKTPTEVAKGIGAAPNTITYWRKRAEKQAKASKPKRRKVGAKRATKARGTTQSSKRDELDDFMDALESVRKLGKRGRKLLAYWLEKNPLE